MKIVDFTNLSKNTNLSCCICTEQVEVQRNLGRIVLVLAACHFFDETEKYISYNLLLILAPYSCSAISAFAAIYLGENFSGNQGLIIDRWAHE